MVLRADSANGVVLIQQIGLLAALQHYHTAHRPRNSGVYSSSVTLCVYVAERSIARITICAFVIRWGP